MYMYNAKCIYLIRESADVSGELGVRGKLTDMVHKKLHHFEMTLHTLKQTHNERYQHSREIFPI